MTVGAAIAAGVSAVATIAGGRKQRQASKAQLKSEKQARQVENAVSRVENQKAIRQRIASQRVEAAELTSGAEASGVGGSSSLLGSVGSSLSTAAGDIGLARTRVAGSVGASNIRSAGASKANSLLGQAGVFSNVGAVAGLFANVENNQKIGEKVFGIKPS